MGNYTINDKHKHYVGSPGYSIPGWCRHHLKLASLPPRSLAGTPLSKNTVLAASSRLPKPNINTITTSTTTTPPIPTPNPPKMADRPPPSTTAIIVGTAILSLLTGYMIGTATSLNLLPSLFSTPPAKTRSRSDTTGYDDEEESSEEEIEAGEVLDHAPNWTNGPEADKRDGLTVAAPVAAKKREVVDDNEECKLVLVVRTDLGMTKGMFQFSPLRASAARRPYFPNHTCCASRANTPQEKSLPNVATPCSHATRLPYVPTLTCAPGSAVARPKSRCRSTARRGSRNWLPRQRRRGWWRR